MEGAGFCNHCGASMAYAPAREPAYAGVGPTKSNVAAGVLAILLGGLGIHKFYLGYTGPGIILLAASFLSLLLLIVVIGIFGLIAIWVITLVEGILYLTKANEEFHYTYVENRKDWF